MVLAWRRLQTSLDKGNLETLLANVQQSVKELPSALVWTLESRINWIQNGHPVQVYDLEPIVSRVMGASKGLIALRPARLPFVGALGLLLGVWATLLYVQWVLIPLGRAPFFMSLRWAFQDALPYTLTGMPIALAAYGVHIARWAVYRATVRRCRRALEAILLRVGGVGV